MSGKYFTKYLLALVILCLTKTAFGQSGPGKGYGQIPQDAYSVVAEVRAKPGKREALRAATLPLITLVRSDPKNLVYFFQEDRENPTLCLLRGLCHEGRL
jgi:hypothetical protein